MVLGFYLLKLHSPDSLGVCVGTPSTPRADLQLRPGFLDIPSFVVLAVDFKGHPKAKEPLGQMKEQTHRFLEDPEFLAGSDDVIRPIFS